MSVVSVMAAILNDELQDREIFSLSRNDCEAMVRRMIERTAEVTVKARARTEQD